METPRERGERLLRQIDGDTVADNLMREYEALAPDFVRYLVEFAFGEVYARPGDLRQRELVAVASLATLGGCDRQLETHVHGAFNVGLSETEIVEAVMTLIPYIGFPRALNAVAVVKRVVEKRQNAAAR
ncbi:MAG: carboxymuconolactone decarboxylase family protein [Candidatus Eremiobacteraeota bacterium]|nr:carboxymuconolactone decarboxylase family protein [Candidatus Eremiobacteraeota bacterium]